jgi:hypothetical protein
MYVCHSVLSSPPIFSFLLSLANYGCGVKVCYQHCDVWGFGLCRCFPFCSCFTERLFCGGGEAGVEMDTEYMWLSVYIMRLAWWFGWKQLWGLNGSIWTFILCFRACGEWDALCDMFWRDVGLELCGEMVKCLLFVER